MVDEEEEAGDDEDDVDSTSAASEGDIVDDEDEWAWLDQVSARQEIAKRAAMTLLPDFLGEVAAEFLVGAVLAVSSAAAARGTPRADDTAAMLRVLVEETAAGDMPSAKLAAIHQMGVVAAEAIERDAGEGGEGAATPIHKAVAGAAARRAAADLEADEEVAGTVAVGTAADANGNQADDGRVDAARTAAMGAAADIEAAEAVAGTVTVGTTADVEGNEAEKAVAGVVAMSAANEKKHKKAAGGELRTTRLPAGHTKNAVKSDEANEAVAGAVAAGAAADKPDAGTVAMGATAAKDDARAVAVGAAAKDATEEAVVGAVAEDVAAAIVSLVEGSDLVTGQILGCDGGMSIAEPSMPRLTAVDRREAILQAAMEAFADKGLHGTSTETIARNVRGAPRP